LTDLIFNLILNILATILVVSSALLMFAIAADNELLAIIFMIFSSLSLIGLMLLMIWFN